MKRISFYSIYTVLLCVLFTSCDVDNYDGPNAKFRGVVIDKTTVKIMATSFLKYFFGICKDLLYSDTKII